VDEPASDLGVLAAIASSVRNRVIPQTTAMFGEVGLAGEVRGITQATLRVREAAQMGFRRCIMPAANIDPDARLKGSRSEEANIDPDACLPPSRQGRSGEPRPGSPGPQAVGGGSEGGGCELIGVRTVGEALDALLE